MKVTLLMAQTVDGKVAKESDEFINWTCKEDKKFFVAETKRAGVMVMGWNTYKTIGRPLPERLIVVMSKEPGEEIDDGKSRVRFTTDEPKQILEKLETEGYKEVVIAGGPYTNGWFLKEGLIDEVKLTIEPVLFGKGLSLFSEADVNIKMELVSCTNLTPNVLSVHYRII